MHDNERVDIEAWSNQWWVGVHDMDLESEQYQITEHFVSAQLGLHPAIREVDAEDLGFAMDLLRLIGGRNPHDPDSHSPIERYQFERWEELQKLGKLFGRQIARNTLADAGSYAAFRIEQDHAGTDYLTNATNRRGFVRQLEERYNITDRPERQTGEGEALDPVRLTHVYCDVNRFKWINGTLGQHLGDLAIIETAREVEHMFRRSELVVIYRHGGDEFGVILEGLDDDEAQVIVDRIVNLQVEKAQSDQYRQAIGRITSRIQEVKEAGMRLRVEALQEGVTEVEASAGQRPGYMLYINGVAVTRLRDILTFAIGAKAAPVSNLQDIEALRRSAEVNMGSSKSRVNSIINNILPPAQIATQGNASS